MRSTEPVSRRGTHSNHRAPNSSSSQNNIIEAPRSLRIHRSAAPENPYQKTEDPPTRRRQRPAALQAFLDSPDRMAPYVLQGAYYFARHPILWKTVFWPLFWSLLFAIAVFCVFLPLAIVPQAIMASTVVSPWLGVPLAILVAFVQMLVILMIFSAIVLLPITDKLFDQVLILRGHSALVEADSGLSCCGCCSIVSVLNLVVSIVTLPLNLIPFVGTVLWLFVNARFYAWDKHSHYHYELKRRNFAQQRKFVRANWYQYHVFGMQGMALELIPFAGVVFIFTNSVAAALWAADMEDLSLVEQTGDDDDKNDPSRPKEVTSLPIQKPGYNA